MPAGRCHLCTVPCRSASLTSTPVQASSLCAMPIEAAAAAAREGDLSFIYKLTPEELASVQRKVDEDQRTFLHVVSCSGDVDLVKYVLENGGKENLDHVDDEVGGFGELEWGGQRCAALRCVAVHPLWGPRGLA